MNAKISETLVAVQTRVCSRQFLTHLCWCAGLALIVIVLYGPYLFSTGQLLSRPGADGYLYFFHTQSFLHDEAVAGNAPFWNPYVYSGHPFLGDFQSAMLYPITWLLVWLPPALAMNWWFALHLIILGVTMYLWLAWRGCRPFAAFVGGMTALLAGTHFMHVYAGHMPAISSGAWAPLIFLGIDGWLKRRHGGWLILAAFAVAVQLYAGHPQYVYYTSIVAGLYAALMLFRKGVFSWKAALGLLAIYPVGMVLALAQILPGVSAMSESVRSGGLPFDQASIFALPPENLLTLLGPWVMGGNGGVPGQPHWLLMLFGQQTMGGGSGVEYWGRAYLWEMQLFLGVGSTIMAVWGLVGLAKGVRWRIVAVLVAILVLAMGVYTPLYAVLYKLLPFFSSFRGTSKFVYLFGVFAAMLAGLGMERLLRGEFPKQKVSVIIAGAGVLALFVGFLVWAGPLAGACRGIIATIARQPGSYFPPTMLDAQTGFLAKAARLSGGQLMQTGFWLLATGGLLIAALRKQTPAWTWALGVLAILNLCIFAVQSTISFSPKDDLLAPRQPLLDYLTANKTDSGYRNLNMINPYSINMTWRRDGIWGYDPLIMRRYAEFMYYSQGYTQPEALDNASQQAPFLRQKSRMLGMFRCKTAFLPTQTGGITADATMSDIVMGRFAIVSDYKIIKNRDAILAEVGAPQFNPTKTVVLEDAPIPAPDRETVSYSVKLLGQTSDEWTIEAVCDKACLLVMTDAYSKDWRAEPLPGSVQTNYVVMPANHAMRAIPLAAGRHVFRIIYEPAGLGLGTKISLTLSVLLLLATALPYFRKRIDLGAPDEDAALQ